MNYKLIPVSNEKEYAIVSIEDYDYLSQ